VFQLGQGDRPAATGHGSWPRESGPSADPDDGSLQPDAVEIAGRVASAERQRYRSWHREAHDVDPFALKSAERAEIERDSKQVQSPLDLVYEIKIIRNSVSQHPDANGRMLTRGSMLQRWNSSYFSYSYQDPALGLKTFRDKSQCE